MKFKFFILSFIFMFLIIGCSSLKTVPSLKNKIVRGQIIDGASNDGLIGLSVYEFNRVTNRFLTNETGYFEIQFQSENPVIVLSGYGEPIFVKIKPGEFNRIIINQQLINSSNKLSKKLVNLVN